ncbi:MAG TPA: PHP domain-containing protein [Verrucomicrobiae bacterium]|nr:PHP domain-containing protein [Verrucomicrobiae bacterium]
MIKVDMHMHSGEDPEDGLRYPATALIDRAVELGYSAIAITLHCRVLEDERVFDYARRKGLLLIRAVEWNIQKRDVLLYNITQRDAETIRTFDDLRAYKRQRGDDLLITAPHPCYPQGHSLGRDFEPNIDLFEAVEYASMHFSWFDWFNQRAVRIARKHGKPIVASSDAHNLWMFGNHYSMLDAEPTMPSIFRAIREGRVEPHSPPVNMWASLLMFLWDPLVVRKPGQLVESFPPAVTGAG